MRFVTRILVTFFLIATAAQAQDGVLGRGDAVVTGFSGIKPADAPLAPGANPLDEFFIDLDGVSAQISSLAVLGQPPQGQLVATPSKLQIKARQVGQVFAIALDDGLGARVPNIYLGATSAFGLQVVLPDSDGDGAPERVRKGHPNAMWMAGQFGPGTDSGPGSIWKVDGQSGAVSLFTTLPGNSGAGVGDVVFDTASRHFFASDLDTGLIHRIGETGAVVESFDHGVSGRPKKGLAPVNDDGTLLDIKNAAFDSEDPDTWGVTAEERRVHGLAVQNGRLYYAVGGQVWSVGIAQSGFAGDARWEFDANGLTGDGPITDMLFDKQGRIYLAQRGKPRGSYDYSVFAEAEKAEVVRYRREQPDNPATESVWVEEPEAYAIGLPPEHRHAEGGVALGYAHDGNGTLRYGACGEMLWSTGHRLRPGTDDAEAAEADVHGLQGNDVALVRPQNMPPQQSYFTDYDNLFGDAAKSGHLGDVEIWQPCQGAPDFAGFSAPALGQFPLGILPPGDTPPDLPPEFPPDHEFQTNLKLTKRATPKTCSPWGGGWLCQYTVRVTNTGPDNYFGPIMVRDWLPATPAGAVMGFAPTPPWTCWSVGASDNRCIRFGTFLAPGWSVDLTAYAWVPKAYDKCHLTNAARIEWAPPGSVWNSNPFDDTDFASATIPADHCKPGERSDLTIYKVAGSCFPFGGKLRCPFVVGVQNLGPAPYTGVISVEDTIPAGTTAVFLGAPWVPAGPAGNTYTLTNPGANLAPGAFAPLFAVGVDVPLALAKQMNCKVKNEVRITQAPGGSPQNFNPGNDDASAVAVIPAKYCGHDDPKKSNLKIYKKSAIACYPQGNGIRCAYTVSVENTGPAAYNGNIVVNDTVPVGATAIFSGPPGAWTCVGPAPSYTCTHAANLPNPGDLTPNLIVRVDLPSALAKQMNCKVKNMVEIIAAPGGSNQNTDPSDDKADAVASVPAKICQDDTPGKTNLKLEKAVDANGCLKGAGVHHCYYNVTVTNTGPGDYNDKIVVEENIPPGMTAVFNGVGWDGCVPAVPDYACTWNNPPLKPGEKTVLGVQINVPDNMAKEFKCKIKNIAKISHAPGGSNQNTDPNDDEATAIADVPQEICDSSVPRSNLKIEKTPSRFSVIGPCNGSDWCEGFVITITNTGPNPFNGQIAVTDLAPAGVNVLSVGGNDWSCVFNTCVTNKPVQLDANPPSADSVAFKVTLSGTAAQAKAMNCKLTNKAKIDAPLGAPKNFDAADDEDQVTVDLPAKFCVTPVPQCPPGYLWNGERCERPDPGCKRGETRIPGTNRCCPPGQPWNPRLRQCGGDTPPPPPPPACERGEWMSNGHCCPLGREWNGRRCEPQDQPVCPPGTTGTYPKCVVIEIPQCAPGTVGTPPNCREIPRCPPGTTGAYPRCVVIETPRCPNGWSGQPPVCCAPPSRFVNGQCVTRPGTVDTPDCRRGQFLSNGHCCPRGTAWNGQLCSRTPALQPECPPGTTGRFPRCKPIVKDCPTGTVGTPPNCRRIVVAPPRQCPPGTRGVFPNCKRIVADPPRQCGPGMVGRFPNCRPIMRVCPPGTFGRPPICRRIATPPQGGGSVRPGIRLPGLGNPLRSGPRPGGRQVPLR